MIKDYKEIPAAYTKAVLNKDSEALLKLYNEKVTIYDMWESWMYSNRSEWQGAVEGWFGSLGTERVAVSFDQPIWHADDKMASYCAFVKYAAIDESGTELRSMTNRISWVLTNNEEGWQIIHEHSSSPIQMDGMKVLMSR